MGRGSLVTDGHRQLVLLRAELGGMQKLGQVQQQTPVRRLSQEGDGHCQKGLCCSSTRWAQDVTQDLQSVKNICAYFVCLFCSCGQEIAALICCRLLRSQSHHQPDCLLPCSMETIPVRSTYSHYWA